MLVALLREESVNVQACYGIKSRPNQPTLSCLWSRQTCRQGSRCNLRPRRSPTLPNMCQRRSRCSRTARRSRTLPRRCRHRTLSSRMMQCLLSHQGMCQLGSRCTPHFRWPPQTCRRRTRCSRTFGRFQWRPRTCHLHTRCMLRAAICIDIPAGGAVDALCSAGGCSR